MIKNKTFQNQELLNQFIQENDVKVISIETKTERYDTGLPLLRGGTFYTDREVLKVWYEETANCSKKI